MKNGLTISLVFEAQSANYGEGVGNIAALKQISRDGGKVYTYISRQALRYDMIRQLQWDKTPVEASGSGDKTVIQYKPGTSVVDYPEIDLFGYMKTDKGKGATTRSAVARLSNATALETYHGEMDFLTNMGLAARTTANNSIAQSEIHQSFYAYTLTIDLDRVGVDSNEPEASIPVGEKAGRVNALLKTVEHLYRDIKGRRENLAPVFVIGGIYERKSPFFENRIKLNKQNLNLDMLLEAMEPIREDTLVGYLSGTFANEAELREKLTPVPVAQMFDRLRAQVEDAYAGY